jgi:hypothetical protein
MLKNKAQLECIVNEKVGHFYCDQDTPIPVAKEMLFQFQKYLGQLEDASKAAQAQQEPKPADAPVEPVAQ